MNTFDPNHRYSDAAKLARLKNKKLFLFDIDGTIAVGDTLYEGSADLIRYINDIGGRAYYITNNSTKSGLDYVKKFHDAFHLDSTEDQFITSGYMTLRFLKENYAEKKTLRTGNCFLRKPNCVKWASCHRGLRREYRLCSGCLRQ